MTDKKANLMIREYTRTLDEWIEAMQLPSGLRSQMKEAQIVLLPAGYCNCPEAFAHDALDFLNYCQQTNRLKAEICCTDDNFSQIEMCSVKISIGRIFALSTVTDIFAEQTSGDVVLLGQPSELHGCVDLCVFLF